MLANLLKEFSVFSGIAQVRTGADKGDGPQAILDRGSVGVPVYPLGAAADDDRAGWRRWCALVLLVQGWRQEER